jgi:catechol 2,3-dioxygenase-like lactoylglutathione lyase family enzyme
VGHIAFDFDNRDEFTPNHYAFLVAEDEFDSIFGRIQASGFKYGSMPTAQDDMQINTRHGGRGVYFKDADGHSWEFVTVSYSFVGLKASTDPSGVSMPTMAGVVS